jgi:hypothetical protein
MRGSVRSAHGSSPVAELDSDARPRREERREARRVPHEALHAGREVGEADDVATHRRVVERRVGRPLADRDLAVDLRAHEVVDEGRAEPLLGDDEARAAVVQRARVDRRHEPQEERAKVDRLAGVVRLREAVVVERERSLGGEELLRVVPEGGRGVAVLDEVPARAGEGEPPDEPARLGDAIHAVARLGGERQRDLLRPHLGPDEAELEALQQVLERAAARVDREPPDEPVDRREKHEPLGPESDPLRVETEPRSLEPSLMKSDAVEHEETRRRQPESSSAQPGAPRTKEAVAKARAASGAPMAFRPGCPVHAPLARPL